VWRTTSQKRKSTDRRLAAELFTALHDAGPVRGAKARAREFARHLSAVHIHWENASRRQSRLETGTAEFAGLGHSGRAQRTGWMAQGVVDTIMVGRLGPRHRCGGDRQCRVLRAVAFRDRILLGLDTLVSHAYGRNDHDACHHWLAQESTWRASPHRRSCSSRLRLASALRASALRRRWQAWRRVSPYPEFRHAAIAVVWSSRRYLQGVAQVRVITVTLNHRQLVNWFGNWVLINGKLGMPALGVNGSAISTCLARVGMAVVLIGFAWRYERSRGIRCFATGAARVC